jgi:isocitrate lyase
MHKGVAKKKKTDEDKTHTHTHIMMSAQLARRFKQDGMLGYVETIQAVEKAIGCDVLTHQKWSGSEYIDRILSG